MRRIIISAIALSLLGWIVFSSDSESFRIVQAAERSVEDKSPESPSQPTDAPFLVISARGVEELLNDVDYFFESAGRSNFSTIVRRFLPVIGNLKGIDQTKPFGVMMMVDPGEAPDPVFVGFVPVSDLEELTNIAIFASITVQKKNGRNNRYEIVTGNQRYQGLLQENYLFISSKAKTLNRRFPDPVAVTKNHTDRYDIAASLLLRNAPHDLKNMIVDYLRAHVHSRIKKRRGESEDQYRNRTFQNRLFLMVMERLLLQGDALTLGWNLSKDEQAASIDLSFDAKPDSSFAILLKQLGNAPSRFDHLKKGSPALVASSTLQWDMLDKKLLEDLFNKGTQLFLKRDSDNSLYQKKMAAFFRALQPILKSDLLDVAFRFDGTEPGQFVLQGGVQVVREDEVKKTLVDLLGYFNEENGLSQSKPNSALHQGITLYQVSRKSKGLAEQRLYGDQCAFCFGVGPGVLWYSMGAANQTLPALKQMIDQSSGESPKDESRKQAAMFHCTAAMSQWIELLEIDESSSLAKLATETFSKGDDTFSIDCRSTDHGIRLRLHCDAGFIRLASLWLLQKIEGK
ncbi:MAG: hypothetical protein IID46_05990 [Planctomycetes bacterium]|nr:hypothetical protein [Planctomycetota bacterium]